LRNGLKIEEDEKLVLLNRAAGPEAGILALEEGIQIQRIAVQMRDTPERL